MSFPPCQKTLLATQLYRRARSIARRFDLRSISPWPHQRTPLSPPTPSRRKPIATTADAVFRVRLQPDGAMTLRLIA